MLKIIRTLKKDSLLHHSSADRDERLSNIAREICEKEGIPYNHLKPIQRKFILNFKCATCKLQPLYNLDISTRKRPKCRLCGHTVRFGRAGKFGRLRKMTAFELNGIVDDNE